MLHVDDWMGGNERVEIKRESEKMRERERATHVVEGEVMNQLICAVIITRTNNAHTLYTLYTTLS